MAVTAVAGSTTYSPPQVKPQQQAAPKQKAPAADVVVISRQAQQLASDGDSQAKELKESGAQKTSEALRKKA
ncbi:MAG: hypothetical protein WCP10_15380 [Desulfuromonadales bacterium]